ncbi:hypothetical protein [Burkholderia sp. BCC1972]|uniref:hypothetical protein n=1 Tax=Burkholderia sp. BCC1972 TaxID=2817438 RepID=UPI002ABE2BA9|nr:hypothetical protein [Burkholderia sp. BCC1972]
MSKDHEYFSDIILSLFNEGLLYRKTLKGTQPGFEAVNWFKTVLPVKKALANESGNFGDYLVPLRTPSGLGVANIGLWCEWDFTADPGTCKLEVLIGRQNTQIWGFRVDPPHGGAKHNYWHTQFTRGFSVSQTKFPRCQTVEWIDDSTPAYPIALENPGKVRATDAALYALISLYGQDGVSLPMKTKLKSAAVSGSLRHIVS